MDSNPERVYVEIAISKRSTGRGYGKLLRYGYRQPAFESGGLGSISSVCPCDYGYDARVEIIGERGIMQIGS